MFSSRVNDGSLRPLIIHLLPSPQKLFITGRHLTVQWTRHSGSDSCKRPVRHRKNIKNPIIIVVIIIIISSSTGLPAIEGFTSCGVRVAEVESRSYRYCARVIFAKIKKSLSGFVFWNSFLLLSVWCHFSLCAVLEYGSTKQGKQ